MISHPISRKVIAVAIGLLISLISTAAVQAEPDKARDVVDRIYGDYLAEAAQHKHGVVDLRALVTKHRDSFDPQLADMFITCLTGDDIRSRLDFDPFANAQWPVSKAVTSPSIAQEPYRLVNVECTVGRGSITKLKFYLCKKDHSWKIANIVYPSKDKEYPSFDLKSTCQQLMNK